MIDGITTVLLVEDNLGDARLLREMLRDPSPAGYDVRPVHSLKQASEYLAASTADVILLDLGLPDADGLESLQSVRATVPRVPVVVLTGRDDEGLAVQALNEGAQDYLVKGQIDARGLRRSLRYSMERRAMEEDLFLEKERAEITLNSIGDGVVRTDENGNVTFINSAAEVMAEWSSAEATGRPITEVIRLLDDTPLPELDRVLANGITRSGRVAQLRADCVLVRRTGVQVPIAGSVAPIWDRSGRSSGEVMVFHDASAARAKAEEMSHSARHDFLTGLPNRMFFEDRLTHAIAIAPRHRKKVAVLFIDLDGFKHVNDSLGHFMGDKLLQSVGKRLLECVRGSDTVSRQGGDEFTVLLSEVELAQDAAISARRMLAAIAEPHVIADHELRITGSVGISIYPEDGEDGRTLIQNADTAMYRSKESGRQTFQFFRPAMNLRAQERQEIEDNLRRALERRELAVQYQPKINLKTGAIIGAEALLRWTHPVLGLVEPSRFIPTAEDSGLMLPIGAWVLRTACEQGRTWSQGYGSAFTMAVNVSAAQFRHENFVRTVVEVLAETGLDPASLELEVPESVLIKHGVSTASTLKALRSRGVRVAVDDFGTGYSSLGHLHRFPVDTLKIDKSFVHEIGKANDRARVASAVIALARSLNMRVVAEGVETFEERNFLRDHECDDAQGYYFGHPVSPEEFGELLKTGRQTVVMI
jgi:diguanylate cyclase (GGDEF)-like protein/PAS domain S-box-containing protein